MLSGTPVNDDVGVHSVELSVQDLDAATDTESFDVTVANTNESIAIFVLALLYGVLIGANPAYLSYAAWAYVASRVLYAGCYYLDLRVLRSTAFGISLLCLAALLIIGVIA